MSAAPLLSIRDLTIAFRHRREWREVVRQASFDVAPRETVAIVGESGSGKSVTALAAMGLLPAGSSRVTGSIALDGCELLTQPEPVLRGIRGRDIAMIFQEPMTALNPVLPIGAQIAEILRAHGSVSHDQAKAEALRMLERVRIPNASGRYGAYPHEFSGGMRQRVMIAMALVCKPKLLVADEPTTALDVTVQSEILELIADLQQEVGLAVLFITHDMGVVAEVAQRTIVMYRGRILESGTSRDVFKSPRDPYTRSLLSVIPRLGSLAGTDVPRRIDIPGEAPAPSAAGAAGAIEAVVAAPDEPPVLCVRGLTTRFDVRSGFLSRVSGRVHAVENVSFDLHRGETLAIVGESGCGKSTVARSILRLAEPSAGSVRILGKEMIASSASDVGALRRHAQMVFQDPFASLNPRMRVLDIVCEPLRAAGVPRDQHRAIFDDLVHRVGLDPSIAIRYPHEFSGGQRQRICIARALALKPEIVIADESVSALDATIKAQVINLMLDLQASLGIAFLFISHDMAIVERVSHRVAVMYLGEIVEIGPRDAVMGNPRHPYTRRLIAAVPIPDPDAPRKRRVAAGRELKSPLRPVGYRAPARRYDTAAPGHLVRIDDATEFAW